MTVPYALVRKHFPDVQSITPAELYQWIGYPENIDNPNFLNTCAIRMSLALLGAGFPNPGTYAVRAGKYKGRMIETRQRLLSKFLERQLGQPEKYESGHQAEEGVGMRHGIVSFFQVHADIPNSGGHIAIVAKEAGLWTLLRCGNEADDAPTGCYWDAREVWFWPLI